MHHSSEAHSSEAHRIETHVSQTHNLAQIISVWGPTGAPGRTTVGINLAAEMALLGKRVIVVDADTFGSAVATRLGVVDEISGIAAACRLAYQGELTDQELARIAQVITIRGRQLFVLSGITRAQRWPELSAERMNLVFEFLADRFDVIVCDAGFCLEQDEEIMSDLFAPRRHAATHAAIRHSDLVLCVAGADQIQLGRLLRHHAELLEFFPDKQTQVVVTGVRATVAGVAPQSQVRHVLERFAGITNPHLIPREIAWHDASIRQSAPLAEIAAKSKIRSYYRALAELCVRRATSNEQRATNN